MSPAAATRMVAVTERVIPAGGVPRTPKRGTNRSSHVLADEREPARPDRDDETGCRCIARRGDRVHARRRSRRLGARWSAHRPRRGLLPPRGGRRERSRGARGRGHANRATARGVALQGVRRARSCRSDLLSGRRADRTTSTSRGRRDGGRRADSASSPRSTTSSSRSCSRSPSRSRTSSPCSSWRGRCGSRSTGSSSASRSSDSPFARAFFTLVEGARNRGARKLRRRVTILPGSPAEAPEPGARRDARVAGRHDPPGDRARGARDRGPRRAGPDSPLPRLAGADVDPRLRHPRVRAQPGCRSRSSGEGLRRGYCGEHRLRHSRCS